MKADDSATAGIDTLVAEVADQFTDEVNASLSPSIEDYACRYPEIATIIRQVFPALGVLGGSSPSGSLNGDDHGHVTGVLGDFRILGELGRGGMGVVYDAEQISLGRRVALKVLPFAAMLDKQQLARFKNEARAAATLDHPNIVAIHSVGTERGVHYYAMQLIEGRSLAQLIETLRQGREQSIVSPAPSPWRGGTKRARASEVARAQCGSTCEVPGRGGEADTRDANTPPLTPPRQGEGDGSTVRDVQAAVSTLPDFNSREYYQTVARLGVQAAEALDHAHQNGVLHRDIKPANLLLDDAGKLWITDFGLARIEADAGMTMTGDLLGTLRYMSPEQTLGKRVMVDHRSDIYSLGVTLYELLTLRPPFAAEDRHELLRQISFDEPQSFRHISPRIAKDLETIVLKAIEKNPADRYVTAAELALDLQRFLEAKAIKARPGGPIQRIVKWSRRHVAFVGAAAAVLMISTLVLAGSSLRITKWYREAEASAQNARQSATESKAVVDFLVNDLLAVPFDSRRQDRDTTVSALLANAEEKVGELSDEPLVEAAVRQAIAKSYQAILKFDKAEAHATRALEIRNRLLSPTHHETLESTTTVAEVWVRLEKRDEARKLCEVALANTRQALGDDHPDTIESMNRIAWLLAGREGVAIGVDFGDPAPRDEEIKIAAELCDEALSRADRVLGANHRQALHAGSLKALVLVKSGNPQDAASRWRQTLRSCEQAGAGSDPLLLAMWSNVAAGLRGRGQLVDSKAVYEEILKRQRIKLGSKNPRTLSTVKYLAMTNIDIGRWDDAQRLCEEALATSSEVYGPDHSETIHCKLFLAAVLRGQTKGDDARRLTEEVLQWRRRNLGPEHPETVDAMQGLAYDLELTERYDESLAMVNEAIEVGQRVLPPDSGILLSVLNAKPRVLEKHGKTHEARKACEKVLDLNRRLLGPGNSRTIDATFRLSRLLFDLGETEEAKRLLDEAVAHLSPNDWVIRNSIAWYLVTHPSAKVRDSRLARQLVIRACELTEYKAASALDTLAAFYAETADYEAAVKWSENALELATPRQRDRFERHLNSFRLQKPWREEPESKH